MTMSRATKREVLGAPKTPNKNLFQYDDLDIRKWLFKTLGRLTPGQRLNFVNWCCKRQKHLPSTKAAPTVLHNGVLYYSVDDAVNDLAQLTVMGGMGGICADVVLTELERRVRRL
jgi:hypothetical protein